MKVRDVVETCQNGTKIEIEETRFFEEGDNLFTGYEGVVGMIAKCKYFDYEVDVLRIVNGVLVISVHSFS